MFKCKLNIVKNAIKSHSLTLESSFYLFVIVNKYFSKACSVPGSMFVLGVAGKQNREGSRHRGAYFHWGRETKK